MKPLAKNPITNDLPQTSKGGGGGTAPIKEIFSPSTNKVKSASWKRSDRSVAFGNKKSKASRKHSPNWLKINCVSEKVDEASNNNTMDSACRPGTLYSDVVFGAVGTANLVNIRTTTTEGISAQKKLTEALLKCTLATKGNQNNSTGSDHEMESKNEILPTVEETPINFTFGGNPIPNQDSSGQILEIPTEPKVVNKEEEEEKFSNFESMPNSWGSPFDKSTRITPYEEADVVVLEEHKEDDRHAQSPVSYGCYLEQQQQQFHESNSASLFNLQPRKFNINIPQWNFTEPDFSPLGFPKFLCHFDDETYLQAENLAMLSFNLAMGNRTAPHAFKL